MNGVPGVTTTAGLQGKVASKRRKPKSAVRTTKPKPKPKPRPRPSGGSGY